MRYFLFIILLAINFPGNGQNIKIGLRSGVSFSNFYAHHSPGAIPNRSITANPPGPTILPDPNAHYISSHYYETNFIQDMRPGFFSYVYVDYPINQLLSAEIGLGYTQRGIDLDYTLHSTYIDSENSTVKENYNFIQNLRLDYISIPLTFQYKLDRKERFYALAGIYNSFAVQFLINESYVLTIRESYDSFGNKMWSSSGDWQTNSYANLFDAGLLAGVGVNVPLFKKLTLGIDIRSAVGLIDIPKKYANNGFHSFSAKSKNISFETGLKLGYVLQ